MVGDVTHRGGAYHTNATEVNTKQVVYFSNDVLIYAMVCMLREASSRRVEFVATWKERQIWLKNRVHELDVNSVQAL